MRIKVSVSQTNKRVMASRRDAKGVGFSEVAGTPSAPPPSSSHGYDSWLHQQKPPGVAAHPPRDVETGIYPRNQSRMHVAPSPRHSVAQGSRMDAAAPAEQRPTDRVSSQTAGHDASTRPSSDRTSSGGTNTGFPFVSWLIFVFCIAGFIFSIAKNNWSFEPFDKNPFFGPSAEALVKAGAKYTPKIVNDDEWWRLFSAMFLHAGVIHLVMNMIALFIIGEPMEVVVGSGMFFVLYVASGFASTLASAVFLPGVVTIGASGAILGLIGAICGALVQGAPALCQAGRGKECCHYAILLSIVTILNFAFGLLPFIDNFAHVGGWLAGFCLGLALLSKRKQPGAPRTKLQIALAVIGGLVFFGLVIAGLVSLTRDWDVPGWCPGCRKITCIETPSWGCDHLAE